MSFGFGIGDFLSVLDLANKVRQSWVDAPGEYASIRNEYVGYQHICNTPDFLLFLTNTTTSGRRTLGIFYAISVI
jgi:hypothetical protein